MKIASGQFLDARIVAVDDNHSNVRFVEMLLKMAGYTNLVCLTDSAQALNEICEVGCDLALLDLQMPKPNGYDILAAVRSPESKDPFIPVLIFTADASRETRDKALEAGASDFLTKPGDASEILLRVRNFLISRRMQVDLQRSRHELEERVAERTNELLASNEQLKLARDEALSASRTKSRFLANMSHELRTPMNGVVGLTSLLLARNSAPETVSLLKTISASGTLLVRLLDDVLQLADAETYDLSFVPVSTSIHEVVQDLVLLQQSSGPPHGNHIVYEPPSVPLPNVMADPVRIGQILSHLVTNALKFTEKGTVTMKVDGIFHGDKVDVSITVKDTGIGIPPEHREQIFESFTQVDQSLHRTYGGAGLGLTLTKMLVTRMNGTIDLQSEVGAGTTFTIRIPFELAPPTLSTVPSTKGTDPDQPLRVLLAEDNPINVMVAKELLEHCRCQVDVADNGQMAIDMTARKTYDLVLMDIQMPICDGLEATKVIREREDHQGLRRVPIYALTANALSRDRMACLDVGMAELIAKPVTLEAVSNLVKHISRTS